MFWETVGQGIIFTGAVAGSLGVLWKWPVGPVYRRGRAALKDEVREIVQIELEPIKAELSVNDGKTVKDLTLATRARVDDISRQLEQLLT
jgi:hypothetical protein